MHIQSVLNGGLRAGNMIQATEKCALIIVTGLAYIYYLYIYYYAI